MKKISRCKILAIALCICASNAIFAGPTTWIKHTDRWIFGYIETTNSLMENTAAKEKLHGGFLPHAIRPDNPSTRALLVISTGTVLIFAAYKIYKHITKPTTDNTTEEKDTTKQQATQ